MLSSAATDADLLLAFARHRDEHAFRKLAERHFHLIFHTALRRTGNPTMAREVSQEVLCILARKAPSLIASASHLPAWLHRTALFECKTAMRKENSQQRRKLLVHPDDLPSTAPEESSHSLWQRALPHLDQALDQLPAADRRVVLLHFFEGLSFSRIAASLGKTPAAVQRQSSRAVARLGVLLKRRGVALPQIALTAGLAAETGKAAPSALLPSFTAKAISASAGASSFSTLSLMLATHQKIVIPAALLLLAAPLIMQKMAIARVSEQMASSSLVAKPAVPASATPLGGTGGSHISNSFDLSRLAEEAWLSTHASSLAVGLRLKLQGKSEEELLRIMHDSTRPDIPKEQRQALAEFVASIVGRDDPGAAFRGLADAGWIMMSVPHDYFGAWMKIDLRAATDWVIAFQSKPDADFHGSYQSELMRMLLGDAGELKRYLDTFPSGEKRESMLIGSAGLHVRLSDEEAAVYVEALCREISGPAKRSEAWSNWIENNYWPPGKDLTNIDRILQMPGVSEEDRNAMIPVFARKFRGIGGHSAASAAALSREDLLQWLQRIAPQEATKISEETEAVRTSTEETHETSVLHHIIENSSDQEIEHALIQVHFHQHIDQALETAGRIKDPAIRERCIEQLKKNSGQ